MRTSVEDDTAIPTEEMCKAGRLAACFTRPRRRGHVLVAEATLERHPEALSPTLGLEDPWSWVERRLVPHVLLMPAGELGDPLALCVLVETDDGALHPVSVRGGARVAIRS